MTMKNILVPHDSSSFADLAFEKALDLASKLGSKLFLLAVIGPGISTAGMSLSRAKEALDEHENEAKSFLEKLKDDAVKKEVKVSISTINDPSASNGIIRFADDHDIDLIIIGSHGRSGLKKAVLGSVASGVIKSVNCPVMIVKEPKTHSKKK